MRLLLCCLLAMLWSGANSIAQNRTANIRPLTVGDTLPPDLILENVTNYPVSKIRFSELKEKVVILDFFATWCTSCIRSLPKLDSLQMQFTDKLLIILITDESDEKIAAFQKKNKLFASCRLPVATNDTIFNQFFPHRLLPHEVWIDGSGAVKAFTDDKEITGLNIQTLIDGKKTDFEIKEDLFITDASQYVFGNPLNEKLLHRSILTSEVKGLASSTGKREADEGRLSRIYFINVPIRLLLQTAYGVHPSCIILPDNDSLTSAKYCYELMSAVLSPEELYEQMRDELSRHFHYKAERLDDGTLKITRP